MDGLSQYILNVVSRLPQHDDRQYYIVVRPGECPETYLQLWRTRGIAILTAAIAPIGPKREIQFRRWLRTQPQFDVAVAPSNQFPAALTIPTLYVVHDIIYERYPSQLGRLSALKRFWLHRNVAAGLRQAQVVVAVSHFTKQEILRFHPHADADKIQVVYEGWEHLRQDFEPVKVKVPFKDYVLYIGSSRGHKNLKGLLAAMEIAGDQMPAGTGLVIAGDDRMITAEQRAMIAAHKDRIMTTGWLNTTELNAYYKAAKAVVFPSLCEGFGIPVLEAFYYRKPLLLSNASSLPEVAGDAAIYFDPAQPEQMAARLLEALQMSDAEQETWANKGEARLAAFSWVSTAEQLDKLVNTLLP